MHDLDRTLRTFEPENEAEWNSDDFEIEDNFENEEFEAADTMAGHLSEEEEMELAAELLTISNDAELDLFLGKVFRRVGRRLRKVTRPLKRVLKPIARKVLPIAGGAFGTFLGGPLGGAVGSRVGSFASRLFEVDFEAMPPEEQEMEVAKRVVRLAASAAANAARAPSAADPTRVAKAAVAAAAKRHAPGLVGASASGGGKAGRWVRRGRTIVLLGA